MPVTQKQSFSGRSSGSSERVSGERWRGRHTSAGGGSNALSWRKEGAVVAVSMGKEAEQEVTSPLKVIGGDISAKWASGAKKSLFGEGTAAGESTGGLMAREIRVDDGVAKGSALALGEKGLLEGGSEAVGNVDSTMQSVQGGEKSSEVIMNGNNKETGKRTYKRVKKTSSDRVRGSRSTPVLGQKRVADEGNAMEIDEAKKRKGVEGQSVSVEASASVAGPADRLCENQ